MEKLQDMTEPELRDFMNLISTVIVKTAEKLGVEKPEFCLLMFNDPKVTQYAANCTRSSMIEAMKETIKRFEANEDIPR